MTLGSTSARVTTNHDGRYASVDVNETDVSAARRVEAIIVAANEFSRARNVTRARELRRCLARAEGH